MFTDSQSEPGGPQLHVAPDFRLSSRTGKRGFPGAHMAERVTSSTYPPHAKDSAKCSGIISSTVITAVQQSGQKVSEKTVKHKGLRQVWVPTEDTSQLDVPRSQARNVMRGRAGWGLRSPREHPLHVTGHWGHQPQLTPHIGEGCVLPRLPHLPPTFQC